MSTRIKLISYLMWLVFISNSLLEVYFFLNYLFLLVIIIHLSEFIIFRKILKKSKDVKFIIFVKVILFGIFYIKSIQK